LWVYPTPKEQATVVSLALIILPRLRYRYDGDEKLFPPEQAPNSTGCTGYPREAALAFREFLIYQQL